MLEIVPSVRVGSVFPDVLVVVVTSDTATRDLTTVTSAFFDVEKTDGTIVQWTATIDDGSGGTIAPTPTKIYLRHSFQVGDLDQSGEYKIFAQMTVPAGTIRSATKPLLVIEQFQVLS